MLKKTRLITYNLADRDRQHTGVDRSDMNIKSAIDRINAPDTQELVAKGDMFGFYGHEIRARFGMNPPDVWVNPNTGESIRIEPALRTIKLSADNDGNVTTQHEFLDTDSGQYSQKLYANNVGGFSTAIIRKIAANGKYDVTQYHGSDFLRSPNYNTNRGGGVFDALFIEDAEGECAFDNLTGASPERIAIMSALETAIIHQYDSITSALASEQMINHYQNEAATAQNEYVARQQGLERIRQLRAERANEVFDSLICPSVPFSVTANEWDNFNAMGTSDNDLRTTESVQQSRAEQTRRDERPRIFNRR